MDVHRRNESGVMYLDPKYSFRDHDPAPLPMGCFAVGSEVKFSFDQACTFVRFGDGKSESIPIRRARTDIPKLRQILRRIEEVCTLRPQQIRAVLNAFVLRTIWLGKPQQNIGVHEVRSA
jgi:hypothetical protein